MSNFAVPYFAPMFLDTGKSLIPLSAIALIEIDRYDHAVVHFTNQNLEGETWHSDIPYATLVRVLGHVVVQPVEAN